MEADGAVRSLHGPVYGGGDMDPGLSSDSLEESDTDSLCEERRYQSELQNRIHSKYEVTFQTRGDTGGPRGEVTSRDAEDLSHQRSGAEANISPREINTSYSELRYDPDWRKHQNLLRTSDDEESLDVSPIDSPDELSPDPSEGRDSADAHPYWKPLTDVASKNKKTTTKPKPKESGQIRRRGTHQDAADRKTVTAQGETSKQDIIEKNKVTLGVRKEKTRSYLHMHKKKVEESKSEQSNEKSDVRPAEDGSSPGKEVSGAIEESRSEKTPKTFNMADGSSDINAAQWRRMALFSEDYDHQYMTIPYYPDKYRVGPYSSQELLQIHDEGSYYQSIEAPDVRYGHHAMEIVGGAQDSWEMYMYPRLSQNGDQTQPGPPGITYNTHNNGFIPNQITPQTYAPMAKSSRSSSEAGDKGSNERTRPCPSGARKMAGKHQKRLKSFLNEEVKLGGLGPVHSVSEEKKEQLKQQKEYAKVIQERNRNKPPKPREIQVTHDDRNKSTRQKSLEYAKKVPRPQPVPRVSSQNSADAPEKRAMSYDSLFPQMKLLEDLQVRHEKEKMAVAALSALHIL